MSYCMRKANLLKVVHLNRDRVSCRITRQLDIIPARLQIRLGVGGLQSDSQRRRLASTMRDVQRDWHQKLQSLGSAHDQRRQHRLTWGQIQNRYKLAH